MADHVHIASPSRDSLPANWVGPLADHASTINAVRCLASSPVAALVLSDDQAESAVLLTVSGTLAYVPDHALGPSVSVFSIGRVSHVRIDEGTFERTSLLTADGQRLVQVTLAGSGFQLVIGDLALTGNEE